MSQERIRKPHTRSRDGCTTCRKRHVRCDEKRPFCANCSNHGRQCEYPSVVPLRERRAKPLPGQQQPFAIGSDQSSEMVQDVKKGSEPRWLSIYPLSPVSISMPLKSRELLYYFQQTSQHDLQSILADEWQRTLSITINHPDVLRNTLLIAGLHYTWRVGELRGYEPTYLFHKLETMHRLKESLANPSTIADFSHLVGGISTLCLIECSLGNLVAAEMHRNGLVTLMDIKYPRNCEGKTPMSHDEQLTYRSFMLICNILHSIKSRILGSKTLLSYLTSGDMAHRPRFITQLKQWNEQGIGSLDMIMKSMLLFPFLQASTKETAAEPIDASSIITSLKMLTSSATTLPSLSPEQQDIDPGWIWIDGAASKLAYALVSSQIDTPSTRTKALKGMGRHADVGGEHEGFISSWCGIATASELYLDCILGIWNAGEPIECRVLRKMMLVLAQDLRETLQEVVDPAAQDLWLWKALVGACGLANYANRGDDDGTLETLGATFQGFLLLWSEENSVIEWTQVQSRLAKIAWPVMHSGTYHAGEDIWHKAVRLSR